MRVEECRVLPSGALEFDRRWALTDSRGRFVNGKNYVQVHSIRAVYDLGKLEVTLDGRAFSLVRETNAIARWLSERLDDTMQFQEDEVAGFPDDTDSPGPTFVSSASIVQVAEWFKFSVDQTRRRFRANLEFEVTEAFWEDRLYGSSFRVGNVNVDAINPCQRCVVPSRDAFTGVQDQGFQKRFAELRRASIPQFARTGQFNHYYRFAVNTRIDASEAGKTIRVGDPLLTLDKSG